MASRLSGSAPIAIFPWGDVIEDFLAPLDLELSDFIERMSGGWLFGYIAALRSVGMRPFVVCASREVHKSERRVHRSTGAPVWIVPGAPSALPYSSRRSAAQWWRTPWRGFASALRHERCQAMLVQEYEYARYDALALLARVMGISLFATFQGGDQTLSRLEACVRPSSLRQARGLVVASSRERERLGTAYGRIPPLADIPNPIDASEWRAIPRDEARLRLGLAPELFLVVSHGRIDIHRKGLDVLIEAWRELESRPGERRLVVIGSGQDNERFAALLAGAGLASIEWRSRYTTDRDEMRTWLSAADVYVCASRVEGMPVAPLEAMACGLPVVCSRAQGLPDIFARGEDHGGLLVPCDEPVLIAEALHRLQRDPPLAAFLGERGRARVVGHFAIDTVGRDLAAFFVRETA